MGERVRVWLWPRRSWRRSGSYHRKRLLRLSGSPFSIAMGCAVGVFASFTPLMGFHLIIAVAMAWVLRGNLVAAAIGTLVGNPLTFPLIWAGTFRVGQLLLPGPDQDAPARLTVAMEHNGVSQIWPLMKPMLLGSIPVGLVAGCITYFLVFRMVSAVRAARQARLAGRLGPLTQPMSTDALADREA